MGVLVRWAEILGQKVGEFQAPATRNAEVVRKFLCSTYKAYPDRFLGSNPLRQAYVKGWMRSVCSDSLPPPPPQLPECVRTEQAWGTYKSAYNTNEGGCGTLHYWRSIQVFPEGSVQNYTPYVSGTKWYIRDKFGTAIGIQGVIPSTYNNELHGGVSGSPLENVTLPATCINAPSGTGGYDASYTKSTYSKNIPSYCDAGGKYPVTNPPPIINKIYNTKISNDFGDDISYTIKPDINGYFEFPIDITANGISVTIDFGGITIDLPGSDPYPPSGGGDNSPPPEVIVKPPKPINETNYEPAPDQDPPPEEELEEKEEKNVPIVFLKVDIIKKPAKGKTIVQLKKEDNDYFAGYVCWLVDAEGEYRFAPEPIRKAKQIFLAPTYATGYSVYAVNGATLKAVRFVLKTE